VRRPGLAFSGIDEADGAGIFYDNQLRQTSKIKPRTPHPPGERVPDGFLETLSGRRSKTYNESGQCERNTAGTRDLAERVLNAFFGLYYSVDNCLLIQ
jgi:hypothetical protein